MDDVTNRRFDRLDQSVDGLDQRVSRMEAHLEDVRTDLAGKLDNVARGLEATINTGIAAGFAAAGEHRRQLHAEAMHRFQRVIDDAERIGALATRDRRVSEIEAEMTELRDRLARIEQAVGTSRRGT